MILQNMTGQVPKDRLHIGYIQQIFLGYDAYEKKKNHDLHCPRWVLFQMQKQWLLIGRETEKAACLW